MHEDVPERDLAPPQPLGYSESVKEVGMKRPSAVLFAGVLTVTLLAGCATQSFDINPPLTPTSPGQATVEESQPFFVGGVSQSTLIDAAAVCGGADRVARVETETTVLDSILSFVTGGIYSPRTARVYCL